MISARLVAMTEDHADQLTAGLVETLVRHPRTSGYRRLTRTELRERADDVYRNLGRWLTRGSEREIEARYADLGRVRRQEGIPLSEVVFALILTKAHLLEYVKTSGLSDTALDLYQELELVRVVEQFFDKTIYYAARGYEEAATGEIILSATSS